MSIAYMQLGKARCETGAVAVGTESAAGVPEGALFHVEHFVGWLGYSWRIFCR